MVGTGKSIAEYHTKRVLYCIGTFYASVSGGIVDEVSPSKEFVKIVTDNGNIFWSKVSEIKVIEELGQKNEQKKLVN